MKLGRPVGVGIVLLAALGAMWWMQAPTGDPRTKAPPATKTPEVRHAAAKPVAKAEAPREDDAPPDDAAPPPGPPEQDQAPVKPGEYNPAFLPQPSPSYQDDPRRFGQTYRKHADLAGPVWTDVAKGLSDASLAKRARELGQRLADPSADPLETTHAELLLDSAIREAGGLDPKAQTEMDYLNDLASTVIQDGDPSAIPTPDQVLSGKVR